MSEEPASVTHLLYLHGFRSSPRSAKAVRVAERIAREHPGLAWWCPQLPPSPRAAMQMVMDGIASWPRDRMGVIGSSLGGFYATHVAHETGCRAVLLNPAVDPARDLARYIGEQTFWHDPSQHFYFEPRYVDELRAMEHGPLPHPERVLAIVAKGDEVLDWREMVGRYPGSAIDLIEGGDHAISDFDQRIDRVLAFLGLGSPAG
ncbi:YqiA/YcfP family alpha/beta fold hydrolase [Ramlibacter sp.]|uniref:YqiA/YcfP family alpha/beta fold hydrolase n=1 Tax=Ramlibacter sp. TaxID=1917967 RepID=UPI002D58DE94|nr:YqiA/YcfP family alpha/beta fold hydrolase [Ramlibacter sp.]HYD74909.1 YqiA/YcfP family alpha/beta fold hydrolase [Ramlibacter sp.]